MKQCHLLLILVLPGLALAQQCSIPGDCKGTNLGIDVVDSERDCLEHCKIVEDCEWYSYDANDGFCIALQDCPEVDSECTTCMHGENECQLPLMCFVEGECLGTYITHVDVETAEECLERCYNDDPDCKYFSFFTENKICSFFETCSLDRNQTDVVSGERDCYRGGQIKHSKIFLWDDTNTAWIHMPSIYESGNGTTCNQPAKYPIDSYGAVGQVINDSIVVCGGNPATNECFSLSSALNVWVEFPSMDVERSLAASVMLPEGWWVAGGRGRDYGAISSTSLWGGASWMAGPDLPTGRYAFCMVQVNSTHTIIAGGNGGGDYLSDAYLFDWTAEVWTQLPDMTEAFELVACSLYQDSQGGEYILTAGGHPTGQLVQSLNLSKMTEWEILPEPPTDVLWATIVYDGEDLVIVNSLYGNLLRFDENNRTFTVIDGQTLPIGGPGSFALAINDNSLNGCI